WKGFKQYNEANQSGLPQIFGFEAEGAAAITTNKVIEQPETVATDIRIGNPASWNLATEARDESNGMIQSVTDEEIIDADQRIAQQEGVFPEPGSFTSISGVIHQRIEATLIQGSKIVDVLTGNGLKDPQTASDEIDIKRITIPNSEEAMMDYLKSGE